MDPQRRGSRSDDLRTSSPPMFTHRGELEYLFSLMGLIYDIGKEYMRAGVVSAFPVMFG